MDESKIGVEKGAYSAKLESSHVSMSYGLINCIFVPIDIKTWP